MTMQPSLEPALASRAPALSIVIPVYRNEESIPALLDSLADISTKVPSLEVVFVVDGSPDGSFLLLRDLLPMQPFASRLVSHARNFGSFPAIRTGLLHATGRHTAVIAADMQEPPHLVLDFYDRLASGEYDVVVGVRRSRADGRISKINSALFWGAYRRLVQPEIPSGGVDVFGCTREFREQLASLPETNSSLVGLLFWLGYRRGEVPYDRLEREHGSSSWTLSKKVRYLSDSVFAFTDLPIRLLTLVGAFGLALSLFIGLTVIISRTAGLITVPGYAATMLVISSFSALNLFAIGLVGSYIWRTFENTKARPLAVVMGLTTFSPLLAGDDARELRGRGIAERPVPAAQKSDG